jgi:ribosomal protein S12 methylthiotransferase
MGKMVYLEQLGCPKNEVDGQHLLGALSRAGFTRTLDSSRGDLLLVNTCGFIESAKEESIERILSLARHKEQRPVRLVVAGCLAQRYARQLLAEIPEIDALIGIDRIEDVVAAATGTEAGNCYVGRPHSTYTEFEAPRQLDSGSWAYLKISDGCDNACSFCAIPQFRGRNRSRRQTDILAEARGLAAAGVVELVVVAQDTTSYGVDLCGRSLLPELLLALAEVPGIAWVRLMYAFPSLVSEELLDVLAGADRVARYLDLPIQHIDNGLLLKMNRRLDGAGTRTLLESIRRRSEQIAIRTSVIVGHPGESSAAFGRLLDFVADFEFDRLGVFLYSEEEGTPSARMQPRIDRATAEHRRRLLLDLQSDILARRQEQRIGETIGVVVERTEEGDTWGRSEWDAPEVDCAVRLEGEVSSPMVRARCTGVEGVDLVAEALSTA